MNNTIVVKDTVTINEAAKRLGVNVATVREGIISGELPIGSAVKCKRNFSYIIPRERFEVFCTGKDLVEWLERKRQLTTQAI